jgi:hypothetical protein
MSRILASDMSFDESAMLKPVGADQSRLMSSL